MAGNAKAAKGHSKEKRSDCPLVTLGLVLDGSGFVRRSRAFAANVSEGVMLEGMLAGLNAPKDATVIMDRGIATEENVAWLVTHRYLKSELGLRPVYHHKEERADGHLFITVLAYHLPVLSKERA